MCRKRSKIEIAFCIDCFDDAFDALINRIVIALSLAMQEAGVFDEEQEYDDGDDLGEYQEE